MNSFTEGAYKEIYKHPDWAKTSEEWETKFAAKLYHSKYVKEATHQALTRMSALMNSYYNLKKLKEKDRVEIADVASLIDEANGGTTKATATLEKTLLASKDRSDGAGQIGNATVGLARNPETEEEKAALEQAHETNRQNIDDVINKDGNVREQMTMLYNGWVLNGARDRAGMNQKGEVSFKKMMRDITPEDVAQLQGVGAMAKNDYLENLNINFGMLDNLSARHEDKKSTKRPTTKFGKWLQGLFYNDMMDNQLLASQLQRGNEKSKHKGNFISRWWRGMKHRLSAGWWNNSRVRKEKAKEDQKGLGLAHYEQNGMPLSQRELAYASDGKGDIKWKEGAAYYDTGKYKTNFGKFRSRQGMLRQTGSSGTALRMLAAYKMMGASKMDLLFFRLALIAWMVPSKDHSIYEIMEGSHNMGLKGMEDLTEPATMYATIDPLSAEEIRSQYAPNQQFPHETIYTKMLDEFAEYREKLGLYNEFEYKVNKGSKKGHLSLWNEDRRKNAGDLAINIYTSDMYKLMNRGMKYHNKFFGMLGLNRMINQYGMKDMFFAGGQFANNSDENYENFEREEDHEGFKSRMYSLSKISSRLTQDTIMERGKSNGYRGVVYRGTDLSAVKGVEDTYETSSLSSTAKEAAQAFNFAVRQKIPVMMKITLTGKSGVDIESLSQSNSEKEVLLPQGARFRVKHKLQQMNSMDAFKAKFPWDENPDDLPEERKPDAKQWYGIELEEIAGPSNSAHDISPEKLKKLREKRATYRGNLLERNAMRMTGVLGS